MKKKNAYAHTDTTLGNHMSTCCFDSGIVRNFVPLTGLCFLNFPQKAHGEAAWH